MREGAARLVVTAVLAGAAAALIVGTRSGGSAHAPSPPADAAAWRGLVGGARPPAAIGGRMIVVLRSPSLADRVSRAGGLATDRQERRWTAQAYAAQTALVSELGARGLGVEVEHSFARVLNGFSAALGPRAAAFLGRSDRIAGLYPVRAAYPAAVAAAAARVAPGATLPPYDGRGVTVALLDTGVHPAKHVLAGIDVLANARTAVAQSNPLDPEQTEAHGSATAAILLGVAPGATVLPIRVAGWQLDERGKPAVFARSDQLVAGLERAVDPNGDGDAHDAARIALVPLAEPYAAFADSPEARAAGGALKLDTLVVAAAGNDGPAGPGYGSVSGPAGAAGALAVGAADLRPSLGRARLALRTGLRVVLDRRVPLASGARRAEGAVVAPALLFDRGGFSLVAGRFALLPAGERPGATVRAAALAGAIGVLLHGRGVAAVSPSIGVPVAAVPPGAAEAVLRALREGRDVAAAIGPARAEPNPARGRPAPFSSRGLAFDGRLKPDLLASGVAVLAGGRSVTGTSAAAAVAAGAAALVAQARPGLRAADLRSLLTGTARPVAAATTAQGAGLVDAGGAVAAELLADPPSLAIGRAAPGRPVRRFVTLRSLSPRPLRVFVGSEVEGTAAVTVTTPSRRLTVPPHGSVRVPVEVRVERPTGAPVLGALDVSVSGGEGIRVPFTLLAGRTATSLLGEPSLGARARLSVPVGAVAPGRVPEIRPVERLDLELSTAGGRRLGLLARLRDLLPGRYVFALTGRAPNGRRLAPGRYVVGLVATPADGGASSRKQVDFHVK